MYFVFLSMTVTP